jgi:hypothetical protein
MPRSARFCTVVLLIRLVLLVRRGYQNPSSVMRSVALPITFVLLPTFMWIGYCNYWVTGNPLLMPQRLYESQYCLWSQFLWTNPRPEPKYNHAVFRAFWADFEAKDKQFRRQHILFAHGQDCLKLLGFFVDTSAFVVYLYPHVDY